MSKHRFLIVDDDPDLGAIVMEKVKNLGTCTVCSSGHDALSEMAKTKFDLVITDYIMEGGDGASLAHFCKNQNVPVLVVSSFPESQIRPYLPEGVLFSNKFHAVRGRHLEEALAQLLGKTAKESDK